VTDDCAAPGLPNRLFDAGLASMAAWQRGVTDYWTAALRRMATPVDLAVEYAEWLALTSENREPTWSTVHTVLWENRVARLRDFSVDRTGTPPSDVVPTLLLPPQAGHSSCIVDYTPEQSQVGAILDAGLSRVASLDWKGATPESMDAGIEEYLRTVTRAADSLTAPALGGDDDPDTSGQVNLIGDCQGGWLAVIWAALNPERVHTLTIAGAPIDYHCGEPVLHDWVQAMAPNGGIDTYRGIVDRAGGVLPGEAMLAGFIALRPDNEIDRRLQLLANMHDPEYVERYREFDTWFRWTQDIPGAFYLWIVEHLFQGNKLIRGELEIGGRQVDLAAISAPLFLLGGQTDHITPPDQVFALADYASSTSSTRRVTTGGHLGLFMGREALREHWPPLLQEVAILSRRQKSNQAVRA
jgi:poly(3-hydroxybutyrate) depolymerase